MKSFAFGISILAAGMAFAQTPAQPTTPGHGPGPGRHGMRPHGNPDDEFEARLTKQLSLNATQQNTVHTVLAERRVATKGFGPQMQTLQTEMVTAIKNGDTAGIEKATTQMGALHQQEQTAHATAMSKIYASLSADQKTKVGAHLEMLMHGPGGGFGPGFGPGPGRRGGPPPAANGNPQ